MHISSPGVGCICVKERELWTAGAPLPLPKPQAIGGNVHCWVQPSPAGAVLTTLRSTSLCMEDILGNTCWTGSPTDSE